MNANKVSTYQDFRPKKTAEGCRLGKLLKTTQRVLETEKQQKNKQSLVIERLKVENKHLKAENKRFKADNEAWREAFRNGGSGTGECRMM